MKQLKALTLAGAMLLALTACGGDGATEEDPTTGAEAPGTQTTNAAAGEDAEPVELVVWESLEGRSDFIEQAGEAYNELHPNVTIKYENVELTDALGQIALDGPAGVGPDVFAAPSNVVGDLVTAGHILPVADQEGLRADLVEGAIKAVTYEDQIWGVPVTVDTTALFYNKDLIPEAPKTWAEVIEFSKEFNAANPGKYGFVFNPAVYYVAPFLFESPDSLLFGPDGADPATPNTNSPVALEGMEEFMKLREVLPIAAADLDVASVDSLFEGGQAAMHHTGSWNISVFDAAGLNYGVTTMPALEGSDTPSGTFLNSRTMFVSAYSEKDAVAQDFAAFLASPEMLQLAYELTGSIPSADIPLESEQSEGLIAQGEYAFPTPSIPEMTQFWTAMDAAVANIWNGADIQTELDTATQVILDQ